MFARLSLLDFLISACGGSVRDDESSTEYSVSARQNYDKGMAKLEEEEWSEAAKYFAFVKARFPYSKFAVLAELRTADSLFGAGSYLEAIDSYTAIYRNGCSPPASSSWTRSADNNKAFIAQSVVMTPNYSLSTVNALKNDRPDDYYEKTQRSHGHSVRMAIPFRFQDGSSRRWSSRAVATSPSPRSSSASSWPRAG